MMRQFWQYLILVFLLSVPLWILGYLFDATKVIPVKLPVSALQFLCVLVAALWVVKRNRESIATLLRRGWDFNRITSRGWRYGVFLLMPLTVALSYLFIKWSGLQPDARPTPVWTLPLFMVFYGISGYCEQLGWTTIATDKLLTKFNVVAAGLFVGGIWAAWHIIPFVQTHNPAAWVFWQCAYTVVYRVVMTKIYVLTDKSVFATIALHATYNTAFSMMPYYGSSYNPMYMALATGVVGLLVFGAFVKNNRPNKGSLKTA